MTGKEGPLLLPQELKYGRGTQTRLLLARVGANPAAAGFIPFVRAVQLCSKERELLQAVTKKVYPLIAKEAKATPQCVERNIRHLVQKYISENESAASELRIPAGKITNSRAIAAVVEYLDILNGEGGEPCL